MSKLFKYDVVTLIELVESNPCLWDKTIDVFKDRVEKQKAWNEVYAFFEDDFLQKDKKEQLKIVTGLIKSGAMKIDDRPIWYDVYRAFPPESEPHFAKPAQNINVPNIFYPEDEFRADFHKKARSNLPPIDLRDTQKPNATKIAVDMVLADKSLSADQVIDTLKKNGVLQVYTPQKSYASKNVGGANKLDIVSEFNKQSKTETKDHSS